MNTRTYRQFIGGRFIDGAGTGTIERRSPADGRLVAHYAEGTPDDIDLAVEAARTAFEEGSWPRMSGLERAEVLNRLADLIRNNRERLARIEVEEVGKPIRFARGDIDGAVGLTRYAASLAMQMSGSVYTNIGAGKTALITREAVGVVALVTPWNFPALILSQKVPFALAAGCVVVLKPSEFTSGSAFEIAALAAEAGVPSGVFNVVSGYGATVGDHLTAHPGIDFVSFTGSTRTGSRVVANTSRHLVKSSVELGGKSANIVFADADLEAAADGALTGVFFNNGECCVSGSRLFVQSTIAHDFIAKVVERSRKLKVGDPFDEDTDVGALIDDRHLAKVAGLVRSGVEEGAELVLGGNVLAGSGGHFHEATIFDWVEPRMTIFREEIFGPVLSVARFETLEDAVQLANDTAYGLSNYVWSKSIDTVLTVARRLKSGWVQANTVIDGSPQLPLTGVKGSGFGYEMGQAGFKEFTQLKTLLEAGSRDWNPMIHIPGGIGKLFGPGVNWRFFTVPQKHLDNRPIWYPQGKTLGGSSSINAMIYIRCQKEDYDNWATLGNQGWAYEDILPYFRKSEDNDRLVNRYHGVGGPLWVSDQVGPHKLTRAFVRAIQQYGLPFNPDFNGETMYGAGFYQVTCRDGRRRSAAVSYLYPVRKRPNLTVKTHARVLRVVVENGRAVGVELAKGRGREMLRASREVIVSAGAINSPRLLMLSGIGPADELKALGIRPVVDLKGVGRNLQDHLCTNVHVTLKEPISYDGQDHYPKALLHGVRWLLYRNGPAASVIVEGGGFFQTDGASRPDLQIHIAPAMVVRGGQTRLDGHGFTINSTFLRPRSVGSVKLKSSDPADEPLVDPNYLADPYDRSMALKSVRIIREVLAQSEIAKFIEVERLPGPASRTDDEIMSYIRQFACCDYHPVGTCKMGIDDMAVVDPELKVHGIEGMRVVDSSIMPVLISGNTNGPTMMIGEKGADLVKGVRSVASRPTMAAVA